MINAELESTWKEEFGTYTKFYPGVYLEELKK
jgi:hypothetical protein